MIELVIYGVLEAFAVRFDIGINEIVERTALLPRSQHNVTAHRELDAVFIVTAEKVVSFFKMFPGLTGVNRHPAISSQIEFGPAVIAKNLPLPPL